MPATALVTLTVTVQFVPAGNVAPVMLMLLPPDAPPVIEPAVAPGEHDTAGDGEAVFTNPAG